jgi:hypothetical protein
MTIKDDGRRAVVYVRVRPTDPERDLQAIDRQRQACEAWCAGQGIDVADVLVNTGIARIPDGALVVCYDISRLSRRPQDLAALLDRNVRVATVTGADLEDPAMVRFGRDDGRGRRCRLRDQLERGRHALEADRHQHRGIKLVRAVPAGRPRALCGPDPRHLPGLSHLWQVRPHRAQ